LAGQSGDSEQSRDREGAVGGLASAGGVASGGAIPGLQGAGGIGGLLAADDANGTPGVTGDDEQYVLFYDAQGNVGQLVKDAVQPLGRYEYDAYGRTIGPDADGDGDWTDDAGPFATTNAYRFSTKPCDDALTYAAPADAGLYYYGYRYYSPRLGRWLSRERLGEDASANAYLFANNDTQNWFDADGLACQPVYHGGRFRRPTNRDIATTVLTKEQKKWVNRCYDRLAPTCDQYYCRECPPERCRRKARSLCKKYVVLFDTCALQDGDARLCVDVANVVKTFGLSNSCFQAIKASDEPINHVFVGVFHVCNKTNVSDMNLDPYVYPSLWRKLVGISYKPVCKSGQVCTFEDRYPDFPNPGRRERGEPPRQRR